MDAKIFAKKYQKNRKRKKNRKKKKTQEKLEKWRTNPLYRQSCKGNLGNSVYRTVDLSGDSIQVRC